MYIINVIYIYIERSILISSTIKLKFRFAIRVKLSVYQGPIYSRSDESSCSFKKKNLLGSQPRYIFPLCSSSLLHATLIYPSFPR